MKRFLSFAVLAALTGSILLSRPQSVSREMAALADAERSFARLTGEKGVGPGFYEFFAEEGVNFTPAPSRFRENYRKRTENLTRIPPKPPVTLDWWPVYGDISAAGDLGYTTGPFVLTDQSPQKRPPFYGFYSSVWGKQADGTWRVLVDLGIDTPVPEPQLPRNEFRQAPAMVAPKRTGGAAPSRDDVMGLEGEFAKVAASRGAPEAYRAFLAEHCRVHSNGRFPLSGRSAIAEVFEPSNPNVKEWKALGGGVAASGDMGYTYGRYTIGLPSPAGDKLEKGHFMRVWRRDASGKWKLTFDVTKPDPAGS